MVPASRLALFSRSLACGRISFRSCATTCSVPHVSHSACLHAAVPAEQQAALVHLLSCEVFKLKLWRGQQLLLVFIGLLAGLLAGRRLPRLQLLRLLSAPGCRQARLACVLQQVSGQQACSCNLMALTWCAVQAGCK